MLFQVVLLFGSETWVMTAEMMQKLEGLHVGFLRQVTRGNEKAKGRDLAEGDGRQCDADGGNKTSWGIY